MANEEYDPDDGNYDYARINVDPQGLAQHADKLSSLATDVANMTLQMENATFQLKLGWAGDTADDAQKFSDRWVAVMKDMFGTDDKNDTNPSDSGVLNVMAGGLHAVAEGFGMVENAIAGSFSQLSDSLKNPSDGATPSKAPSDAKDKNWTAVAEKWS